MRQLIAQASYNDGWMIHAPVAGAGPERVAERCLEWCVREAHINNR
jgi:hypothetical protein